MTQGAVDVAAGSRRGEFEAWLLTRGSGHVHALHGAAKQAAIGVMRGTVLEIGPGPGINMRYYASGVRVLAVEPHPAMHDPLRAAAAEHGVDLDLVAGVGEQIDLPDASVDAVVCTFVLCGVADPSRVLAEALRVSRPGSTLFALDHVAAPTRSVTRLGQAILKLPHRWLFNGCEVDRDLAAVYRASEWSDVSIDEIDGGVEAMHVRPQIVVHARREP